MLINYGKWISKYHHKTNWNIDRNWSKYFTTLNRNRTENWLCDPKNQQKLNCAYYLLLLIFFYVAINCRLLGPLLNSSQLAFQDRNKSKYFKTLNRNWLCDPKNQQNFNFAYISRLLKFCRNWLYKGTQLNS